MPLLHKCPDCAYDSPHPQAVGTHRRRVHGYVSDRPKRAGQAPPKKKRATPKKQDEALIVLDVLCPKGVPVPHLDAVNAWVEQTRALLKLLRG